LNSPHFETRLRFVWIVSHHSFGNVRQKSPPHVALNVASQFPIQCGCIDPR
jgi:hypothetical protein